MLAKINSTWGVIFVLTLALLLSGCTPAGPRALLKGKKYLERGDVADALTQFKRATTLLATNANAWNYFGVALQRAGQPDDAAAAYQTALRLDHDLVEAHFNFGLLSLEQNRPDLARSEFTAYTLRRPNDATGWLKLGYAQLRGGDAPSAERSFSTVLSLKTNEAEAYNALGLARLQTGKALDAARFFAAAVQARADFAPALQNLATVNLDYLHDNRMALANFQAYLALTPRPANYNEVKAIAASLTQSDAAATVMAPAAVVKTSAPPAESKPKATVVAAVHPAPPVRTEPVETVVSHAVPHPAVNPAPETALAVTPVRTQTVEVHPEPLIVTAPKINLPVRSTVAATRMSTKAAIPKPVTELDTNALPPEMVELPVPEEQTKPGFWHRLFNSDKPTTPVTMTAKPAYQPEALTPIAPPPPAASEEIAGTKPEAKPVEPAPHPVASISRYTYTSPQKPASGDRHAAEAPFAKARLAEEDENWPDAQQFYQTAADTDAAWFEAQYNAGVIAHRLHNYAIALPRYELALAIQPESGDARYNFALALKASGYATDAAEELKKILATNPDEVRAQLALANLCAQSLHDVPQARQHYLRVLELQPNNPQAADIRFWLSANSK